MLRVESLTKRFGGVAAVSRGELRAPKGRSTRSSAPTAPARPRC